VNFLGNLLRRERDQHAEHNYPDLTGEDAPAVKRFGQVYLHTAGPQRLRERNRRPYVRNGWKAAIQQLPLSSAILE
jgi:hypothetical protein